MNDTHTVVHVLVFQIHVGHPQWDMWHVWERTEILFASTKNPARCWTVIVTPSPQSTDSCCHHVTLMTCMITGSYHGSYNPESGRKLKISPDIRWCQCEFPSIYKESLLRNDTSLMWIILFRRRSGPIRGRSCCSCASTGSKTWKESRFKWTAASLASKLNSWAMCVWQRMQIPRCCQEIWHPGSHGSRRPGIKILSLLCQTMQYIVWFDWLM